MNYADFVNFVQFWETNMIFKLNRSCGFDELMDLIM